MNYPDMEQPVFSVIAFETILFPQSPENHEKLIYHDKSTVEFFLTFFPHPINITHIITVKNKYAIFLIFS